MTFLAIIIVYLISMVMIVSIQLNSLLDVIEKNRAKNDLFRGIINIIKDNMENGEENKEVYSESKIEDIANEIQEFHSAYLDINIKYTRHLKNINLVLNEMNARITIRNDKVLKRIYLTELIPYKKVMYELVKHFKDLYPYFNHTSNQQKILNDVKYIVGFEEQKYRKHVLDEINEEFAKLNLDIEKGIKSNKTNYIMSVLSIVIGLMGIIIPIISSLSKMQFM